MAEVDALQCTYLWVQSVMAGEEDLLPPTATQPFSEIWCMLQACTKYVLGSGHTVFP